MSICVGEWRALLEEVSEYFFRDFRGEKTLISFATLVDLILRFDNFCLRCWFLVFVVTVLPPSDHLDRPLLMAVLGFSVIRGCEMFTVVRVSSVVGDMSQLLHSNLSLCARWSRVTRWSVTYSHPYI